VGGDPKINKSKKISKRDLNEKKTTNKKKRR
jgi:hypothetical protein